jgi:predicted nucleic acid-binding protein
MEAWRWAALSTALAATVALTTLLDSVVLIDHLNGISGATSYLKEVHGRSAISVISRAEVLAGFDDRERAQVMPFLNSFPTLDINRDVADLAGALRHQHGWKLPDAFQAALASRHRLKLATRNLRDFPPGRFAFLVSPYTV